MSMRHVLVIGSGIAGIETALTIARTMPEVDVTVVGEGRRLRIVPNLVYVPFGLQPDAVDVSISRLLAGTPITHHATTCTRVDVTTRTAQCGDDVIRFDAVVVATGASATRGFTRGLRNVDDALRLRSELEGLARRPRGGSILVRVLPGATWSGPATEWALLAAVWAAHLGIRERIDIAVAMEDMLPIEAFGYEAGRTVEGLLEEAGITLLSGLSGGWIEDLDADVLLDVGELGAHTVRGLLPGADGFYECDATGRIAPGAYVVGDASWLPYKGAFATALHARHVAAALGGDLSRLGPFIDGVPVDKAIYQLDTGHGSLHVEMDAHTLEPPFLARPPHVTMSSEPPVKLRGLLLRELLGELSAALTPTHDFESLLRLSGVGVDREAPRRAPSGPARRVS